MKEKILIVDAYNMIGNWPELARLKKSDRLEDARDQLLLILSDYHKQSDSKIIVVFDAMYVPGLSKSYKQYSLDVVWTDEGQTADSYIEALAGKLQSRLTQVTVATSDQAEQWTIFSQGALRNLLGNCIKILRMQKGSSRSDKNVSGSGIGQKIAF